MIAQEHQELLGPRLTQSLHSRGFTELTAVQTAALEPSAADCDLRITSRTGSGKTVAIGLALRPLFEVFSRSDDTAAGPRALVVVPTRELAKQVRDELTWLFEQYDLRIACVTGGSSYRDERRALAARPGIVVGTPGRLIDHIGRGTVPCTSVATIVLDEADRMLDLGFAEDIDAIFAAAPNRTRTHLVSATLAPEVMRLANRFQNNPRHVQGTRPGEANADIEHLVHVVPTQYRVDALINVLMQEPEERTLVFVKTRLDVGSVAQQLTDAGFRVATLSGDMEQQARDRALGAFKQDKVRVLVATDVAARGIDVQGMTRVIHLEPPMDPDSYTHRSGRTGRAGQKGSSIVFVAPERQRQLRALLAQARVSARMLPLPAVDTLQRAADDRTLAELSDCLDAFADESRANRIAAELLRDNDATKVVAMLVARTKHRGPEPREIPNFALPEREPKGRRTERRAGKFADEMPRSRAQLSRQVEPNRGTPTNRAPATKRFPEGLPLGRKFDKDMPLHQRRHAGTLDGWGMFQVSWGQLQGADPRRMLAVLCRRGNIRGTDVGAIRIGPTSTIVEVRNQVAADFAVRAKQPDPQAPKIRITELEQSLQAAGRGQRDSRAS